MERAFRDERRRSPSHSVKRALRGEHRQSSSHSTGRAFRGERRRSSNHSVRRALHGEHRRSPSHSTGRALRGEHRRSPSHSVRRALRGEHRRSPSREDSVRSLRSSSLAPVVLASRAVVLATAPSSPTQHSTATAPHASPASASATRRLLRRATSTSLALGFAPVGRSPERAAARSGSSGTSPPTVIGRVPMPNAIL